MYNMLACVNFQKPRITENIITWVYVNVTNALLHINKENE